MRVTYQVYADKRLVVKKAKSVKELVQIVARSGSAIRGSKVRAIRTTVSAGCAPMEEEV